MIAYGPAILQLSGRIGVMGVKTSSGKEKSAAANPEVDRLKDALRQSDLSIQKLEEEVAGLRKKLSAAESAPRAWYNDQEMLDYRSPWEARRP
jgi:hypothetical protein